MCFHAIHCHIHEFCCNGLQGVTWRYMELHGVTWSSGILLSAVVTKCLAGMRAVLDGLVHVCPCIGSNFQIVRVFCATKIFFLIFDTF
jgi:hypothetical protein